MTPSYTWIFISYLTWPHSITALITGSLLKVWKVFFYSFVYWSLLSLSARPWSQTLRMWGYCWGHDDSDDFAHPAGKRQWLHQLLLKISPQCLSFSNTSLFAGGMRSALPLYILFSIKSSLHNNLSWICI